MRSRRCKAISVLALLTVLHLGVAADGALVAAQLTTQEGRGKQIYLTGTTQPGRTITAFLGDESMEVSGEALPCVNCHGYDGRGRPEGGVVPSNITWEYLTKPYGTTYASGRKAIPYTESSLARAITEALDAAGNKLTAAMPRYRMDREDLAALLAYMKRLGKDLDPGLTETSIRVATILPASGPLAPLAQDLGAILTAYFEELNEQEGIYNRKIELREIELPDAPNDLGSLLEKEEVFALVGAFTVGADKEIASLAAERQIPLVAPLTLSPHDNSPVNRYVFYLFSGMRDQARASVVYLLQKPHTKDIQIGIVYPADSNLQEVAQAIVEECQKASCQPVTKSGYSASGFPATQVVNQLRQAGVDAVFLLTKADGAAFMAEADRVQWTPDLYLIGSQVGTEIFDSPRSFHRRVFLAYPIAPADPRSVGMENFRSLLERRKVRASHTALQIAAYCAAKIFVEGLKRAGRELSREKLVSALEGLYEFETGLSPPVTYGPNRRIGALGASILAVDLEKKTLLPVSDWIVLNSWQ